MTHPSVPATNIKELVAYVKTKKPGELSAGTSGQGTTAHLSLAQFNKRAGVEVTHVPYRGGVPSLTAASGQRSADDVQRHRSGDAAHSRAASCAGLATTGPRRAGISPDIPTMSEAGLPGFNIVAWVAFVAPAGTPKDILLKLHEETTRAAQGRQASASGSIDMGIDPIGMPPDEFAEFLRKEIPRWKVIVRGGRRPAARSSASACATAQMP